MNLYTLGYSRNLDTPVLISYDKISEKFHPYHNCSIIGNKIGWQVQNAINIRIGQRVLEQLNDR